MLQNILIVVLILIIIVMAIAMCVLGFKLRDISNVEKYNMKLENDKLRKELIAQKKLTELADKNKEAYGKLMEEVKALRDSYREKVSSFEDIERLYREQLEIIKEETNK